MADESIVYLNGAYLPRSEATFDIEDRAAVFADAVYEVTHFCNGKPLRMEWHLARLGRSLEGVRMPRPDVFDELPEISAKVVSDSGLRDAYVYWKVTRGSAPRDRAFPTGTPATVLVMAAPGKRIDRSMKPRSIRAALAPDRRWLRCNLKTVMLLDSVLAKQEAIDKGLDDAIYQRDGIVTESTAANVFIVSNGVLKTHPANHLILAGITRQIVMELIERMRRPFECEAFAIDELLAAQEVFITGTMSHITAVTQIDETLIGDGRVGAMTEQLHRAFVNYVLDACS